MKIKEVRELTTSEIRERMDAEETRLSNLKINHAISPLDDYSQIKKTRRDIARFATELRLRQLNNK
ncbi:MAG: 50S ribosomal protein L29 [Prevotellaceae bacterium]|jgi:large subunit ribosomal protein L29|nr:50S ribosomal protein L29 [Prevotellaceae bacterium]